MIQPDRGQMHQLCIDDINRIQAPTKTNFKNRKIWKSLLHEMQGSQGAVLEIGQGRVRTRLFDCAKSCAKLIICSKLEVMPDSFVVNQQMWRSIARDRIPGLV